MNKPTLINLDNSLDDNYVYDSLGSNQHSLLHALIRILNRLQYPESAIIPNKTLEHKSGIPSRTFHRTRESLLQYRIDGNDPESWVVKYEPSNHGAAGRYWLNYSYILSNYKTPTSYLHDTDINTTTQLHDDTIIPTSDLQDDCNTIQKNDESGNIHRIDKNRTDENKKNKIRIGSVDDQYLNDKDDSEPTYSQNERAIINGINKKCGTTWDGGMGTPNYAILQEIATYSIVIVQQGIDRLRPEQKPPGMLSYLRKVIINGLDDGSISDDFQPAMKDPYKENPYLYARDRFYSMMGRDQLDWEGFQKDGKLRYMASASLGFVETARDALNNEQLLGEVIEKHPIMLEVLADIEKTAQEVYDAEPR